MIKPKIQASLTLSAGLEFPTTILQPVDAKCVSLVSIGGAKVIRGGNGIADGPVDASQLEKVMEDVIVKGLGNEHQPDARLWHIHCTQAQRSTTFKPVKFGF